MKTRAASSGLWLDYQWYPVLTQSWELLSSPDLPTQSLLHPHLVPFWSNMLTAIQSLPSTAFNYTQHMFNSTHHIWPGEQTRGTLYHTDQVFFHTAKATRKKCHFRTVTTCPGNCIAVQYKYYWAASTNDSSVLCILFIRNLPPSTNQHTLMALHTAQECKLLMWEYPYTLVVVSLNHSNFHWN